MSFGSQINYKQLLERHKQIRVPMIQRDYAQGRPAEVKVREEFLNTIKSALDKPSDDQNLPLNLDFIYGSVEGDEPTRFLPLDGQQRLTTLFLLHWYLAWKDDQLEDFKQLFFSSEHSCFAYSVRPSSTEFFGQLVVYRPNVPPEGVPKLSAMIVDQPWYFRSWRLDPTIQAVLHMLDAIHDKFGESQGLFARLLDEDQPAITFQLLDLENFGLSDDLYIKMNARGKPLTAFETFKARYEQELLKQFQGETFPIGEQSFEISDYVARRMDTAWADLFWAHRSEGSDLYDYAFMNIFRAVALISRNPESDDYLRDFTKLRAAYIPPSYTDFHAYNWLDEQFTRSLMRLLDSWCSNGDTLRQLLPNQCYFDENAFFKKIVSQGTNLSYTELVEFTAYANYILVNFNDIDSEAFNNWMRVLQNLAVNTRYNRHQDFRRSVSGLVELLQHSRDILAHFAEAEKPATGFSEPQIVEEKLKAQLILSHSRWRVHIDRAESHGYFRGQIGFILEFSGIIAKISDSDPSTWDASEHASLQNDFKRYFELAETMFSARGLNSIGGYRWQRALLSLGDYLLPRGRNHSFLVNSLTDEASWKRLIGGSRQTAAAGRNILKRLFDKLSPDSPIAEQLDKIITESDCLDPWRDMVVHCPKVFEFCESRSLRFEDGAIYLLKRLQMNGSHAELFTFCLHQNLRNEDKNGDLSPLILMNYYFVNGISVEPGIRFSWSGDEKRILDLKGGKDDYILYLKMEDDDHISPLINLLVKKCGFTITDGRVERKCAHSEIRNMIDDLRNCLNSYTEMRDHDE